MLASRFTRQRHENGGKAMGISRKLAAVSIFAIAASLSPLAGAQSDAGLGTWKLNVAKSKFNPGPAPKDATITFEQSGKGVKSMQQMTNAKGEKISGSYTAEYNGKDYPITGSPSADTVALKFAGGNTVQRVDKKGGKVVSTFMRSVAADGKTMTVTQKGTTPDGKPVDHTMIFEKQK
jgi:hypothetical protein